MPFEVNCFCPGAMKSYPAIAMTGSDCPDNVDALVLEFGLEVRPKNDVVIQVPYASPWTCIKSLIRAGYAVQFDPGLPTKPE